jgi:hypothetical protein
MAFFECVANNGTGNYSTVYTYTANTLSSDKRTYTIQKPFKKIIVIATMGRDNDLININTDLSITLTTGQYSQSASDKFATSESRYGTSFKTLTSIFENVNTGCVVTVDFGTASSFKSTVRGFQIIGIE